MRSCPPALLLICLACCAAAATQAVATTEAAALAVLEAAMDSDDPFLRANAVEGSTALGEAATSFVERGLSDRASVVRFAALVTLGRLQMTSLAEAAERLDAGESVSVRAARLYALHRVGRRVDLSPLAGWLGHEDPSVRGNAAMLLGMLGDDSAVPLLLDRSRVPMRRVEASRAAVVRLQFAEAVLTLGDERGLDAARAGVYSQFDEVRVLAVQILGRCGDAAMLPVMEKLLTAEPAEPLQVRLAAAETLARLGRPPPIAVLLEGIDATLTPVRVQAVMAAAHFHDTRLRSRVTALLQDPDPAVRLAAAAVSLRWHGQR